MFESSQNIHFIVAILICIIIQFIETKHSEIKVDGLSLFGKSDRLQIGCLHSSSITMVYHHSFVDLIGND